MGKSAAPPPPKGPPKGSAKGSTKGSAKDSAKGSSAKKASSPKPANTSNSSLSSSKPKPTSLPYAPRARAPCLPAIQAALDAKKPPTPLARSRRIPLIGACLVGAGIAFYIAGLGYSLLNPSAQPSHAVPADVSDRYDRTAAIFDAEADGVEKTLGLHRLRRKLAGAAHGDVLEVSAGTGRNTRFYDWSKVRTLVLLDQSAPMLEIAKTKWEELQREKEENSKSVVPALREKVLNVEFRVQSALEPIEGPPRLVGKTEAKGEEPGKFDTVVQTMGLCSTAEPEKLLQRMNDVLKRDGRIWLLEHGKSSYGWLNKILDQEAPGHADKYGCWWNKDIGTIVERSGLEVVEISRPWYHLGTTWWVELRKGQRAEAEAAATAAASAGKVG